MPEYEIAKRINSRIAESSRFWQSSSVFTRHSELLGLIASQLAFALEDAPIDYLTAEVSETSDYVGVLVFAGTRIVWTRTREVDGFPSTSIFNADHLESVELMSVPNLLAGGWGDSERLTVVVGIDGVKFTLPADGGATGRNVSHLREYLPKLLGRIAPVS